MSNYATNRFQYEQWTGSNAQDVIDLMTSGRGWTYESHTVDENGVLWIVYTESAVGPLQVQPDDYLVVGYNWLDQAVSPAKFAEWFITA